MFSIMKVLFILALSVLTVSVVSIAVNDRVNGENGWYVPQANGTFEWVDMKEAEAEIERLQLTEDRVRAVTPISFYLYTAANPVVGRKIVGTPQSIKNSNFNPANPTRFIIHGYGAFHLDPMNIGIRQAWLGRRNTNVISVDWPTARSISYASSVSSVRAVGRRVAILINFLVNNRGVSPDSVHLVGASLGAHVAGFAGKNTKRQVRTIVALDAALPLFNYNRPATRLAKSDAFYVESIHTNGGGLGFLKPIGNGAFYVNGGKSQPGCLTSACSHISAVGYYIQAVRNNNLRANRCSGYLAAVNRNCGSTFSPVRMGAVNGQFVNGNFYVPA